LKNKKSFLFLFRNYLIKFSMNILDKYSKNKTIFLYVFLAFLFISLIAVFALNIDSFKSQFFFSNTAVIC